jgi:hypothetical protein
MTGQPAPQPVSQPSADPGWDSFERLLRFGAIIFLILIALPLSIPVATSRLCANVAVTRARFWTVWKWHWLANILGITAVIILITAEIMLLSQWVSGGGIHRLKQHHDISSSLTWTLWSVAPWLIANFVSGTLLLPVAWSIRRRRTAELVRTRRIPDVVRQERIEAARKRAADRTTAGRIGIQLDAQTGQIVGIKTNAVTVPQALPGGLQAFGYVNRATMMSFADRMRDIRRVRDWIDPTGGRVVLPMSVSAVRALIVAESGAGKTVLLNGLVLCAVEYGWPVFVIDAKGDPEDAEALVATVRSFGRTVSAMDPWHLFNGTPEQVTSKLMRLMPVSDGANQHYLDEIRGVLQAVQHETALTGVADLRQRLSRPAAYVRDQYDLGLVNQTIDRSGATAGSRALHSLLVALRPLERWISDDGWSFAHPKADVTVIPLSPVDDAQASLGDLLMLDLRHFLARRLERRDKTPVVVIVDEFAQLVTGTQDPGDTAGSLFETARSAGVGLVLAAQSPAGLSNDETRRRRAMTSGAALIFGRSKDPEDIVKYAGTVMRMEASARPTGEELGSGRAQHTFVIPPQDVREAADGAFWLIQSGAIAPFRALPHRTTNP